MKEYWAGELHCRTGGVGGPVEEIDFSDLIGATINQMGFHPEVREGGLTIDYTKDDQKKRVIFGFNDLGLWKEWEGIQEPSVHNKLLFKISELMASGVWDSIERIQDDPLNRCYRFFSDGDDEVLKLSVSEIKLFSENIRELFSRTYDDQTDRLEIILGAFYVECVD